MTIQEMAEKLHGREYPFEPTPYEIESAIQNGYVVVFGSSDDLTEFRGAIYDEGDAPGDHLLMRDRKGTWGISEPPSLNEQFVLTRFGYDWNADQQGKQRIVIKSLWCPPGLNMSWAYELNCEHATFDVMEDGEIYCRGVVFALPKD